MHHIKALKTAKAVGFINVMKAMNRKQIPVCKSCHVKIHNGSYDKLKLSDLSQK
jgi:predicted HNH restriction endonuclease